MSHFSQASLGERDVQARDLQEVGVSGLLVFLDGVPVASSLGSGGDLWHENTKLFAEAIDVVDLEEYGSFKSLRESNTTVEGQQGGEMESEERDDSHDVTLDVVEVSGSNWGGHI